MSEDIGAMYDRMGQKYLNDIEGAGPPELDAFMDLLPSNGTVLDVGCAGGRDSERFAKRGFHVVGIDLSNVFIEEARKRVPEGKFYVADLRDLEFFEGTFDAIWAQAVLLHIPKEEISQTLANFYRMLKPGGKLHIRVKEGEGQREVTETLKQTGEVNRHFTFFQLSELQEFAEKAGFKILASDSNPDDLGRKDVKWIRIWGEK